MAIFNPDFFTDPAGALDTEFGIPSCITALTLDALSLIPSTGLGNLAASLQEGQKNARTAIADKVNAIFKDFGLFSYDSATGRLNLFSASSKHGIDLSWVNKAAEWFGFASEIESLVNQGISIAEDIQSCVDDFKDFLDSTAPPQSTGTGGMTGGSDTAYTENMRSAQLAIAQQEVAEAEDFIERVNNTLINIGTVLAERQREAAELGVPLGSGVCSDPTYTTQRTCELARHTWFPTGDPPEDAPIFRLIYGPPVSKNGIFILSEDGLYYNSQSFDYNGKDIPSASDIGVVLTEDAWGLDYDPNLGGKGVIVTLDYVNKYVNTVFDVNAVDNGAEVTEFYDQDHMLQVIGTQKQKLLYDTSAQIGELLESGHSPDSAIVLNHKQNLFAVIDSFNKMQNKRKKQIEIAYKAYAEFGITEQFPAGDIPINDFSYLSSVDLNISLAQQQELTFETGSVEGVVLPIKPKFVKSFGGQAGRLSVPFNLLTIGKGSIVNGGSVSSVTIPTISINDEIESSKLFSIFNFLKPAGQVPSSEEFLSLNCATLGIRENAQLIGKDTKLFVSGLGVPKLGGLVSLDSTTRKINGYRSICRIPSTTEHQDFLYNLSGGSFDCWLHMPGYGTSSNYYESGDSPYISTNVEDASWGDYNYYKVLLANENVGGNLNTDVSSIFTAYGTDTVRGMLMGFTRDPSIYSPSLIIPGTDTNPGINAGIEVSATTASSCFFIAPTMALDKSSATFTPHKGECISSGFSKMVIDDKTTVGGKRFLDLSGQFMHLSVSFDTSADECRVYLDSQLMATSSLGYVFGVEKHKPPSLPTFASPANSDSSSFYYASGTTNQADGVHVFDNGPYIDAAGFTPWVLGGGWTDGLPFDSLNTTGGFMGKHHGWSSGLGGHVGSVKFYSKPLSTKEVLNNFNAQKGFYKNIIT